MDQQPFTLTTVRFLSGETGKRKINYTAENRLTGERREGSFDDVSADSVADFDALRAALGAKQFDELQAFIASPAEVDGETITEDGIRWFIDDAEIYEMLPVPYYVDTGLPVPRLEIVELDENGNEVEQPEREVKWVKETALSIYWRCTASFEGRFSSLVGKLNVQPVPDDIDDDELMLEILHAYLGKAKVAEIEAKAQSELETNRAAEERALNRAERRKRHAERRQKAAKKDKANGR